MPPAVRRAAGARRVILAMMEMSSSVSGSSKRRMRASTAFAVATANERLPRSFTRREALLWSSDEGRGDVDEEARRRGVSAVELQLHDLLRHGSDM